MHFAAKRSIIVPAPNGYFLYCITTVMIVKKISAREGLFSMLTNYHTHTTRCLHATGSDEEFVLSAIKGGYQELGFSDHTPWKYHTDYVSDIRMTPEQRMEMGKKGREKMQKEFSMDIVLKHYEEVIGS